MNYIISILPVILYLLLIKGMDGFSIAKWSKIGLSFRWGIYACIICWGYSLLFVKEEIHSFPIVEEIIKALPLVIAIHKKKSVFFVETLSYGAAIGAGFSMLENILYIYFNPGFALTDAILRGAGTSLLHIGCTALLASTSLVCFRITSVKHKLIPWLTILAFVPAIAIHFIYNMFLLPDFVQMLLVIILFIGLFVIIYAVDEKQIHSWLDLCITNDIALYKSIKEGKLQDTNAGQYLIMARERFNPEVFFDICVFLGLYLELSIAAKSRLIMQEAGMEMPVSEKERKDNQDKLTELQALQKNIGKAGVLVLKPLINIKDADLWAMNKLK